MTRIATTIPYVRQRSIVGAHRTCGAAALAMVYRSYGRQVPVTTIWRDIAQPGRGGQLCVRTHRLAGDALRRGFAAVCLRVKNQPMQVLHGLLDAGWRVIVNHRLAANSVDGHYSVVTTVGDDQVTLHDPSAGPHVRRSAHDLLACWMDDDPAGEFAAGVLVAICQVPLVRSTIVPCPLCSSAFPLPESLGVSWSGAWLACWGAAYCPTCDACAVPSAVPVKMLA